MTSEEELAALNETEEGDIHIKNDLGVAKAGMEENREREEEDKKEQKEENLRSTSPKAYFGYFCLCSSSSSYLFSSVPDFATPRPFLI